MQHVIQAFLHPEMVPAALPDTGVFFIRRFPQPLCCRSGLLAEGIRERRVALYLLLGKPKGNQFFCTRQFVG
jgi:hypothetical protein